ncbi:bifunctional DNA primase/polymerase [Cryptosporangium sp. NPDC048952]|uniref:bifunctional DNA primase/polymerase n=1 Tax=Cryptosporangium sp. NPDC048952 TaxID=3363961 RepID=UPI0037146F96
MVRETPNARDVLPAGKVTVEPRKDVAVIARPARAGRGPQHRRVPLAEAAEEYLSAGWSVTPGAYWNPQSRTYRCGRPHCDLKGPHPVDATAPGRCRPEAGVRAAHPAQVTGWWHAHGYAVMMPTGALSATVLAGPPEVIDVLAGHLEASGHPAPVLAYPSGEHQLFSAPLVIDEALWLGTAVGRIVLHGAGSWVTLPPSTVSAGRLAWLRPPWETGWRLPPSAEVLAALRTTARRDDAEA